MQVYAACFPCWPRPCAAGGRQVRPQRRNARYKQAAGGRSIETPRNRIGSAPKKHERVYSQWHRIGKNCKCLQMRSLTSLEGDLLGISASGQDRKLLVSTVGLSTGTQGATIRFASSISHFIYARKQKDISASNIFHMNTSMYSIPLLHLRTMGRI
jgi:hypothetical protein